ncbi:MAG: heme-copper oxidase subunit III [Flavobacteriaceae bacterium]|nr:heme-copper oxidase subunit III [Flavobacteriaceae bacterium]
MDLTQGTEKEKIGRAKKTMLWFAMISMTMTFAGLTSAYVVSSSRPDWLKDFDLPPMLLWSTIAILISSVTIHMAKNAIQKGENKQGMFLLLTTMILGVAFVVFQLQGFSYMTNEFGYNFTGPTSNVVISFIYILVSLHMAHLFSGFIVLLVVVYNHYKQRYGNGQTLGLELGVMFWHFLDFLWVYLFLFFYFVR